jgi:DNA-binding LacI/PurR family transcriptional regulator
LILVDRQIPSISTDFIGTDNAGPGTEAARHLLELGHKRFLFCSHAHVGNSVPREKAFFETISSEPGTNCRSIDFMAVDHEDQLREVFANPAIRPTGVLCFNDWTAIEVRRFTASMGLEAPRDFSIIGCGDQHFTDSFALDLTTFDQKPYRIGQCAAECYLTRVHSHSKQSQPQIVTIPAQLLARGSTGPAPAQSQVAR